jgi:tetratricopeptide (TPR) repeat protein
MVKLLVAVGFCLTAKFCLSQSSNPVADSLKKVLKTKTAVDSNKVSLLLNIAFSLTYEVPEEATRYANEAMNLAEKVNWVKGKALSYRQIGLLYYVQSDFMKAMDWSQKALKTAKPLNNKLFEASVYNNIGNIYADLAQHKKALEYYEKYLDAAKQINSTQAEMGALNNIATIYIEQNDLTTGLTYLTRSLAVAEQKGYRNEIIALLNNIARVYDKQKNYQKSLEYYQRCLHLADTTGNKSVKSTVLNNIASVYLNQDDYRKAEKFSTESLGLAKDLNSVDWQANAWQTLSSVYEKQDRNDKALHAYRNYIKLRDSIVKEENKSEITRKEMRFEQDKKEALLKAGYTAEINKQSIIKNSIVAGAVIILVAFMLSLVFYKRKRDAQQRQKEAEFKTQVADTEMKALRAQMNPHFIFNSLNSIGDYIAKNNSKMADDYLNKFARLMRMILENSEKKEVLLTEDLKALELYMQLESFRMSNKFTYAIKVDSELDPDNTLVPPLILQPFVENSIWHGLAQKNGIGNITIDIKKEGDMINCIVEDNGIGRLQSAALASASEQPDKKSLGMKITTARIDIINRVKQSAAAIHLSDLQQGTRVEVKLPLELNF